MSERNVLKPVCINSAEIWSIPADLYFSAFQKQFQLLSNYVHLLMAQLYAFMSA
jgi:hypothetical protein